MTAENLLRALWRRKLTLIATVVLATTATYIVSKSLPKVYVANASLFVGNRGQAGTDFEAVQSGQVLAKTYAELIQSKNVATRVAAVLPGRESPDDILASMEFEPVSDTQLLLLSAEGPSEQAAASLANTYSQVFVAYAAAQLAPQTKSEVLIADPARASSSPVRPKPLLYTGVMFVLSVFLGAGLALLRDRFDTRLGSDEEIGRALEMPVVGRIPRAPPAKRGEPHEQRFPEAFRVLRTNLTFLRPGGQVASVLVSSPGPGEGKSTLAMGLARVVAEQGKRVLVVEADMRRPMLGEALGSEAGTAKGLTHFLVLGVPFDEVVHETATPNVYLVPAGAIPPSPSSLLQHQSIRRLLDAAEEWADFVIFDSPPISVGAEASILANEVEEVIFVVNHRLTSRTRTIAAVRQLRQAGASLAGLVVNEVPLSSYDYYADYYYAADSPPRLDGAEAEAAPPRSG